jgi:hypothetical protein
VYHPGWGSGQYGPYGDPAGPGTPAQGEPGTGSASRFS